MRLVFAGTPEFAERALSRLLDAGHDVGLVVTQPDRPRDRGLHPMPSAVKRTALARGLEVIQPETLKSDAVLARLRAVAPDVMIVAAYGLLLPPAVLDVAPYGALNIHASLLPRWRGAAPIQRAILAGDPVTGVSVMQMTAGLDTGPVFARREVPIAPADDTGTLHDKLAVLGAEEIVRVLVDLRSGRARAVPQRSEGVTYAPKIEKGETRLDWSRPAVDLERAVRAFRPSPGAATRLGDEELKLWRGRVVCAQGSAGTVLEAGDVLVVACGEQALAVGELQRSGGRRMSAREFLRGREVPRGSKLG